MTTVQITTTTCDACGKSKTEVGRDRFGCTPDRLKWATLEWEEAPLEGDKHNQWQELSICPEDLTEIQQMIAAKRAAIEEVPS